MFSNKLTTSAVLAAWVFFGAFGLTLSDLGTTAAQASPTITAAAGSSVLALGKGKKGKKGKKKGKKGKGKKGKKGKKKAFEVQAGTV